MLEIEIDGKAAAGGGGQHRDGCCPQRRRLYSALLLPQEAVHRRQLPHVPGAGREGAEAVAGLRHAGDRRHEGADPFRDGDQGAEGGDGVPADQPSARLPDLRPGRRVPVAGPGGRLRRQRLALPGREAGGGQQGSRPAGLDRYDPLHPLHPLRALRPGDRRDHGAGHGLPRRAFGDHVLRRAHGGFGTVGQHDRPVPGRCAHLQAVPLLGPHLGAVAPPRSARTTAWAPTWWCRSSTTA